MRRTIALAVLALTCFSSPALHAQTQSFDTSEVFRFVEQMPSYNGDLQRFLHDNLRYPDSAREQGAEGRVVLDFIISAQGNLKDIKVIRSSGNEYLDAEALRIIQAMPPWNPGKQNGKAVNVLYTLPISFRLD